MHLYVHEFQSIKDNSIKEVRDLLFENSLKDYQMRKGIRQKNLKIETTKHGKPFFPRTKNLHFSISHSGKFWICIFDEKNVGVDIEDYSSRNISVKRFIDIANRFFKPDEKDYVLDGLKAEELDDGADEELKQRFFRIWTAKEAYMKYTGNGFSEGFKNFSILDDSLKLYFKNVPIDPRAVLTFCAKHQANLDELINI